MTKPLATVDLDERAGGYGARTLLYVDDSPDAVAARDALESIADSVDVRTVRSVEDALSTLRSERIHCVVTEYTLPDGTGLDILDAVRETDRDLPVVLFTADGTEAIASAAIDAGITGYLKKRPLDDQVTALADRVGTILTERTRREAILGRMTDAFFALDEDWRFTYLNDRGREVIGEASVDADATDDFVGTSIWEVVPEAVGTEFYDAYHRAMDQQEPASFEAFYEPLETWFDVRAYPSPTGLSVYFRDVTERREHEQSLAEREQILTDMYRVIAEKGTPFEEKVDRLLELGSAALGTESAAFSRVDDDDYVFEAVISPTESVEPGDVVALQSTNCERAIVEEETLVLADISSDAPDLTDRVGNVDFGISCYLGMPIVVDDEVYGTFCFYDREPKGEAFANWEVTLVELMGNWISYELERERRELQLTRERNRLEDFASHVSHDLRNPLTVAAGRLEIVGESYDGDPEHLAAVERALNRMDELIDDVLTLARSGDRVDDATPTELRRLVTDGWKAVECENATLEGPADDLTVVGDASRLQQLFENLFRNAVDHGSTNSQPQTGDDVSGGDRPHVTVSVGVLPNRDGFYVSDDGPGIPETDRERVFESGYTTREDGTGFGLRIVREIVEAHGGTISVTDGEAGGARFEVSGLRTE
ncbi:ATP-binding protein [Haloarcula marina]|uniref:ATP-binding protein n=1 Tax=Haloarcula marina TaxID=2961574 RepID=UPI0020B87BB6|nr:ATP-binding protein [Halomicroarcula marina]